MSVEARREAVEKSIQRVLQAIDLVGLHKDVTVQICVADVGGLEVASAGVTDGQQIAKSVRVLLTKDEAGTQDERYVLGIVLEPLKDMGSEDLQQDTYSAEEVRKACYLFMEQYGNLGLQHKQIVNDKITILENYIAPVAMDINGETIAKGTWMMAVRIVDDEIWSDVKAGKLTGFSIGGFAISTPVT